MTENHTAPGLRRWAFAAGGALGLLVGFALSPAAAPASSARSEAVSVKKDLKNKKADLQTLQRRLEKEKAMRRATERREKNVLSRLDDTDRRLERLSRETTANLSDLSGTARRIQDLEVKEKEAGRVLEERREALARRLKALRRARASDPILSASLGLQRSGDFSRRVRFGVLLARSNQDLMEQVEEEHRRLEETRRSLTNERVRKERIVAVLEDQKKRLTREKNSRKKLLSSIRNEKAVRESAIAELDSASRSLSSKVGELIRQQAEAEKRAEEERRAEEDRLRKEAEARAVSLAAAKDAAQREADKSTRPRGHLASALKGGIGLGRGVPWPVKGTLLQGFGQSRNREFNTTLVSSGLQIRAAHGAPVRAVASGRVRYADWFQGYGKLVILDHGRGYYSLYAQASDLYVAAGDQVAAGQTIAAVGDTGSLVGDSLYFEIRKDGIPQDPLRFLRSKS